MLRPVTILLAVLVVAATADAQTVRVIDTSKLYETGGIARWLAARAKLDSERKSFKLVESPDGKTVKPRPKHDNKNLERLERELEESERQSREAQAWSEREREVLDPIEADVRRALEAFAKKRGIDLLLDRDQLGEGLVFVSPAVDVTAAFIAEYNKARPK